MWVRGPEGPRLRFLWDRLPCPGGVSLILSVSPGIPVLAGALFLILLHRVLHPSFWRGLAILASLSALMLALGRLGQPPSTGFLVGWDPWGGVLNQPTFRDGMDSRPFAVFASLILAVWTGRRSLSGAGASEIAKGLGVGSATLFFVEADDPLSVSLAWGSLDLVLLAVALVTPGPRDARLVRDTAMWSLLGLTAWLAAAVLAPYLDETGILRLAALWIRLGLFPAHSLRILAGQISPGLSGILPALLLAAGGGLLAREGWPTLIDPVTAIVGGAALVAVARGLGGSWRGRDRHEGVEWVVQAQIGWLVLALAAVGPGIEELITPYLLWLALGLGLLAQARQTPTFAAPGVGVSAGGAIWILGAAALLAAPPLPSAAVRGLAYVRLTNAGWAWVGGLGALVSIVSVPVLARRSGMVAAAVPRRLSVRDIVVLLPSVVLVTGAVLSQVWMGAVPLTGSPLAIAEGGGWLVGWSALLVPILLGYGLHRYGGRLRDPWPVAQGILARQLGLGEASRRAEALWTRLVGAMASGEAALEERHLTGWLILGGLAVLILLLD